MGSRCTIPCESDRPARSTTRDRDSISTHDPGRCRRCRTAYPRTSIPTMHSCSRYSMLTQECVSTVAVRTQFLPIDPELYLHPYSQERVQSTQEDYKATH
jgi:hypothetical protein